jgi:hypothetical protein
MIIRWAGDGYETLNVHNECVYAFDDETMLRVVVDNFDDLQDVRSDGSRITRFVLHDKLYINLSTIAQHCSDLQELSELIAKLKQIFSLKRLEGGLGYLGMKMFVKKTRKKVFRLNRQAQEFVAQSFRGGRCECYRTGKLTGVSIYDINSAYPFAMTFQFPEGAGYLTKRFNEKQIGWWKVKFKGEHDYFVDVKKGIYDYEGEGILTTEEVMFALQNDFQLQIEKGLVFSDSDYTFRDFVLRMYELRQSIEDKKVKKIIKLALNSLSMKFAQKEFVYSLKRIDSINDLHDAIQISDEFVLTKSYKRNIYSNIAISALITTRARLQLYRAMRGVNTIYCDTDSIHTQDAGVSGKIKVGDGLGEWKIQAAGVTVTYRGRKMYYIHDTDELKAAGARVVKKEKIAGDKQIIICERIASIEEILSRQQVVKRQHTLLI